MQTRPFFAAITGMTLLTSARAGAQCPDGTPPPCAAVRRITAARAVPQPDARARRFLLVPFRNVTRAADQDWLVTGIPLMLGEALGQFRDLAVVPEERFTAARRRLGIADASALDATQLRKLADETDGWTVVTGNIVKGGSGTRISAQATDVVTSKVLARTTVDIVSDADVRGATDRVAVKLLEAVGVPASQADLQALTTSSVDAYRAYVRGVDLMQRSRFRAATAALNEAVKIDSTFALAWMKLSMVTFAASATPGADPITYRAIENSVRAASRLPPRKVQLIKSLQAFLRGQFARSRAIADSLAATDPDDLDAKEVSAIVEFLDPILDSTSIVPRRRGSMQHAVSVARDVLDRDPGRRNDYSALVWGYGLGAGMWGGFGVRTGNKRELGSLMATMMAEPDARFEVVMRDTLALISRAEYERLPEAERAESRRRSGELAWGWVERWLAAGPEDAEAHLFASRIAELRDDLPRALRELAIGDSLGVESRFETVAGRRMGLLVQSREYARAAAIADSLARAGTLAREPFDIGIDPSRRYGLAALLLTRQWGAAQKLAEQIGASGQGRAACDVYRREVGEGLRLRLPVAVRAAVRDTVAAHAGELRAVPGIGLCMEVFGALVVP